MSTLHIELLDGDLYCCPVCYTEALLRHKGGSPKDDDDDGDISDDTTEFDNGSSSTTTGSKSAEQRSDPMSILCGIGLHEASTFCYERISEVKEHVRSVHGFSPSVMAGNNLFHRFQVSVYVSFLTLLKVFGSLTKPFLNTNSFDEMCTRSVVVTDYDNNMVSSLAGQKTRNSNSTR